MHLLLVIHGIIDDNVAFYIVQSRSDYLTFIICIDTKLFKAFRPKGIKGDWLCTAVIDRTR